LTAPLNQYKTSKIVNAIAVGHTEHETAGIVGVARSTVSNYKRDPEIRALIDEAQTRLAKESAVNIVETDIAVIKRAHKILAKDKYDTKAVSLLNDTGLMDLYTKISKRVGQAIGIFNTPAPSLFIQNMYQDNRSQAIAPNVLTLISGALAIPEDTEDQPIIDGEYSIIE
jgi:hypothetical protein